MLPEYFIIERKPGKLWDEYIKWLNKKYHMQLAGDATKYYGYDGGSSDKGSGLGWWANVKGFYNTPVLLTLEEWAQAIGQETQPEYNIY